MAADHTENMTIIEEETVELIADRPMVLPAIDADLTVMTFAIILQEDFTLIFRGSIDFL